MLHIGGLANIKALGGIPVPHILVLHCGIAPTMRGSGRYASQPWNSQTARGPLYSYISPPPPPQTPPTGTCRQAPTGIAAHLGENAGKSKHERCNFLN